MNKLSFGYWKDADTTLKSWVPKLRQIIARLIALETDEYLQGEVKTNQVFLGRPVYRKLVDVGAMPNTGTKAVSHGIDSLVRIFRAYGMVYNGSLYLQLPYADPTAANSIGFYMSDTDITINAGVDRTGFSGYIVLEYIRD